MQKEIYCYTGLWLGPQEILTKYSISVYLFYHS
jgi:hypothetical protein